MLPNLAGISLHSKALNGVRDVGVNLEGMPGEILSMIIGAGNDARSLCAAADTLRQTSKDLANHQAWLSLANKYNMPDTPTHPRPPSDSKDVEKWRKFVLSWCDDIRVGKIQAGGYNITYDHMALLLEQSDGTAVGYKWLLHHGYDWGDDGWGDGTTTAGSAWMFGMAMDNVTNHKKLEILKLQIRDLGFYHQPLNTWRTMHIMADLFDNAANRMEYGNLHDTVSIVSYLHHTHKAIALYNALNNDEVNVLDDVQDRGGLEQEVDRIVDDAYDQISKTSPTRSFANIFPGFVVRHDKFLQMVVPLMEGEGREVGEYLYYMFKCEIPEEMKPTWRNIVIRPPTSKAIQNFLCNLLKKNQFETANWFFTRHENLVREDPVILFNIEDLVAGLGWTAADETVKEWRRRVPEPPPPP
jgi:hypothetical protein